MSVISLDSERNSFDVVENLIQHNVYSSFGVLVKTENSLGNDITGFENLKPYYSYTGREFDSESGFYYYRARVYDAHIGRFLQKDVHNGIAIGPKTIINKYIYVLGNPVRFIDPSGEFVPDVHGNYCGNQENRAEAGGGSNPDNPPATDSLDEACMQHDLAYYDPASFFNISDSYQAKKQFNTDSDLLYRGTLYSIESLSKGNFKGVVAGVSIAAFGYTLAIYSSARWAISEFGDIIKSIFD
ncbi:RHS repeat-associated core domain-containing protein [Bacteriovoracaceae bacterium]|nr:RHS repeat-associated core domain-containing protein [Bacteriovoracaceae bacterium]